MTILRSTIPAVLGIATLAWACTARANDAPVYRCQEAGGGVLYRSAPCAGGQRIELDVQPADPAAAEKLARDRELLANAAAERRTNDARERAAARAAADRRLVEESIAMQDAQPAGDYGAVAGNYGYGYTYGARGTRGAGARFAGNGGRHRVARNAPRTISVPPPVFHPHRG